jgi:hypothetical protein
LKISNTKKQDWQGDSSEPQSSNPSTAKTKQNRKPIHPWAGGKEGQDVALSWPRPGDVRRTKHRDVKKNQGRGGAGW